MTDPIVIVVEGQPEGWVPFWFGLAVDHIVETCPLRAATRERLTRSGHWRQGVDLIDPHGTDICGWCRRVWIARDQRARSNEKNPARGDAR